MDWKWARIDKWDRSPSYGLGGELWTSFSMTIDKYYDFQVEYRDITGLAFVKVYWSSSTIIKTNIPRTAYYTIHHIKGNPSNDIYNQ